MIKLLKKIFPFLSKEEALLLNPDSIRKIEQLSRTSYDSLNEKEKIEILELGAEDFSNKFSGVIKTLANE